MGSWPNCWKIIRSLGAIPAEKGYDVGIRGIPPYPASICISINDEVIHGVPSKHKIIKDGDIVSVDTVALKKDLMEMQQELLW